MSSAGKKARSGGKGKKKAWNKLDIKDVEKALDDKRHEERTLGGKVDELKDAQLFFVDKSKDTKKAKATPSSSSLRCYQALGEKLFTPREKVLSSPYVKVLAKKIATGDLPNNNKPLNRKRGRSSYDLWDEDGSDPQDGVDPDIAEAVVKKPPKVPKSIHEKSSHVAAITVPDAGSSYLPDPTHHEDVLAIAVATELDRKERGQYILAQQPNHKSKALRAAVKDSALGMEHDDENGADAGADATENGAADATENGAAKDRQGHDDEGGKSESEDEAEATSTPVDADAGRKTRKERKKEKKRRMEELEKLQKEKEKLVSKHIDRLPKVLDEIHELETTLDEKKKINEVRKNDRAKKPKRLGPHRFEPVAPAVALTDEITGHLRNAPVETKLILDRFKNLQERQLIEPRRPFKQTKRRRLTK